MNYKFEEFNVCGVRNVSSIGAREAQFKAQLAELKFDLVTRMTETLTSLRKALDASDAKAIAARQSR
jgi:hypothetical protein